MANLRRLRLISDHAHDACVELALARGEKPLSADFIRDEDTLRKYFSRLADTLLRQAREQ
jgi:hypothetical protein